MKLNLQEAFAVLKKRLGSHRAAAKALGINSDHYCAIRNGRANIPARTENYIILKASELNEGDVIILSTSPTSTATSLTQSPLPGCDHYAK